MNNTVINIKRVKEKSIAEELDIVPGDKVLSINGKNIYDILDYKFLTSSEYLELEIEKQDGEVWIFEVEKEYDEDLGLEFESSLIDKPKSCRNKCIFCFIDQLPPNLRSTLYFKDDDVRLSFLQGNYVTFTNSSEDDIQRIIDYKISPINISVHATDPEVRRFITKNPKSGDILDIISKLSEGEIKINCQIVLCPNINDKDTLDKTITDLVRFWPNVMSIAIVPVAVTKHRDNLFNLETFNPNTSVELIHQIEKWQKKFKQQLGSSFVFIADEFYINAEHPIPPYRDYEEFHQLEDGIGMIAKFEYEVYRAIEKAKKRKLIPFSKEVSVVTGKLAYGYIRKYCDKIENTFSNVKINVYPIENTLLGDTVTVSGLISGKDIIEQLQSQSLGSKVLLPSNLLRSEDVVLLDNVSLDEIERTLGVTTKAVKNLGEDFVDEILY